MALARPIVLAFGVLFLALGLGFWAAPDARGARFDIEAIGLYGLSTLRADLGGLFVGMGLLMLVGGWKKHRGMLVAAAVVISAIVIGRVFGAIAGTWTSALVPSLMVEVIAVAALVRCARAIDAPDAERIRGSRRAAMAAIAAIVVLGVGAAILLNPKSLQSIIERGAAMQTAGSNESLVRDDAMRVLIAGSSAPLPSPDRAKASVAVFAAGKFWVVDVGPESVESLVLYDVPLEKIGGVLFTHFHSDHIGDLGELNLQTWAQGRPSTLTVYGGPGVNELVDGFNLAYRQDQGYRTAHHTAAVMPPETWPMVAKVVELDGPPTPELSRTGIVLEENGLKITAIEVAHPPITPAYAFRFDYKGRSVVVTGDYKMHPPLVKASQGADVFVSEAIARPMVAALEKGATQAGRPRVAKIMHDVQDYHVSPEEAAELANQANVRLLVYYHLLPAPDGFLPRLSFTQGVGKVRKGDWVMADDGSLYTLPIGSSDVRIGRLRG